MHALHWRVTHRRRLLRRRFRHICSVVLYGDEKSALTSENSLSSKAKAADGSEESRCL
jgi:hypothetical protein